jgi:NADH-quinone oxidoreductase subunit N
MPHSITLADLLPIIPEIILTLTMVVAILADLFVPTERRSDSVIAVSLVGMVLTIFAEIQIFGADYTGFFGTVVADDYSILLEVLYLLLGITTILLSRHYIVENGMNFGEYYILLISSILGMMLMSSSLELLVIFVGLELMSISSYILVGMKRKDPQSGEAALKYLLLGAFSTGFLLYGISMLYGATGSTYLPTMLQQLQTTAVLETPLALIGIALVTIGLGFKVAVAPFHMWTPDVYSGAPTPISGFLSAASKAAGFAIMIRILLGGIPLERVENWEAVLGGLATVTMTVGNLLALQQKSVKRMLAYSSIAHAGYMMIAIAVGTQAAIGSVVFYAVAYAFVSTGAFGVLTIQHGHQALDSYDDLRGYAKNHPQLALMMTLMMVSLIGLPLTGGFVGKLQLFGAALESEWVWLAMAGILNSAVSVYYYLKVISRMYMSSEEACASSAPPPRLATLGVALTAAATLYLGIFPDSFLRLINESVRTLM